MHTAPIAPPISISSGRARSPYLPPTPGAHDRGRAFVAHRSSAPALPAGRWTAECLEADGLDPFWGHARRGATLEGALVELARAVRGPDGGPAFVIERGEDEARVVLVAAARPATAEFLIGSLLVFARRIVGAAWRGARVRLVHPQGQDRAAALFGVPVVHGASRSCLMFPAVLLSVANQHAETERTSEMELALRRAWPAEAAFMDRVRARVADAVLDGEPNVGEVARRLAMSSRTLQRRLQAEGVSFQAVIDEVRREIATRALVREDLSIAEVGYRLGFADPAAFSRAFRRWTGHTPKSWRAAALGDIE
jgi:AraC-like DNA-binding protein